MMIQAVVFDWGGVVIDDPGPGLMQYCASHLGVSVSAFRGVAIPELDLFQVGAVTEEELWGGICKKLNCTLPSVTSLWGEAFRAIYQARPNVLALAKQLQRRGIKTGLLSNTEIPPRDYFHELGYTMFDEQVFSCEVGCCKPDAEIYQLMVAKLGVEPGRIVFLDDKEAFVAGAKACGLMGIQVDSEEGVSAAISGFELLV